MMKISTRNITYLFTLLSLLLVTSVVLAQTGGGYDLTWWTVDGGGGTVSGSGYTLTGTAGQPEPGQALTGGGYNLYSGFWPGGGEAPSCDVPLTGVSLGGPSSGETGENLTFTASPDPSDATTPINYTWSPDGFVSSQDNQATYNWPSAGAKTVEVTARNCGGQDFGDSKPVNISDACTEVTQVDLTLVTTGVVYTDTVVEFSANIIPDGADKPYTYTIDYDDGGSTTSTSSADPLTTPLKHTFTATGTYDVEIKVWNCDMTEGAAKTDTVQVAVSEQGVTCVKVAGVKLTLVTSGVVYTDTVVKFSADITPDNAGKSYTYTIDYDDGGSTTATSSADPLTSLDHTFTATGTRDVEIAVWNCDMIQSQAITDSVTLTVHKGAAYKVYLPLVVRNR